MKRFITIIILVFIFSLVIPCFAVSGASVASPGAISAKGACLIEVDSENLIYGKNERVRMPMASTTKIMSAIVAIESGIPLDTLIKVPKDAVGIEGSSIYLELGESITLEALIYGLLLCSANDAAVAIAITISGNVENFVAKMNEKAQALGLADTRFENPHGLDGENHYTTAYDLARLMAYCIKNDTFAKISGTQKCVFPKGDEASRVMINHNRLLRENVGVVSGKTGFTKKSGRCLVSVAEQNGMRLICVTLNAPNDWNDHKALYDFGFSNYIKASFDAVVMQIPVISGDKATITVKSEQFSLLLPNDDTKIEMRIEAPRFIFADVQSREKIGRVVYYCNGKIIAQKALYSCDEVSQIKYRFNLFEWLMELLGMFKD